jgi:hypothetical protein
MELSQEYVTLTVRNHTNMRVYVVRPVSGMPSAGLMGSSTMHVRRVSFSSNETSLST